MKEKNRTVLVIVAHPDDEILGCGGTIAKLAHEGKVVHVVFLADGVGSRAPNHSPIPQELSSRRQAAANACKVLGAHPSVFKDYPDNQMDTIPLLQLVQVVESQIATYQPDTVLTHHAGDLNIDHQRVHQAVVTACRPHTSHTVNTLLFFEIPSSTEWMPHAGLAFIPNWFVDITTTLDRKLEALQCYADELRLWPHPRSIQGIEHLARWRGCTVGVAAAEAFMLGRKRT